MSTVYVPGDSSACSVGADDVALALEVALAVDGSSGSVAGPGAGSGVGPGAHRVVRTGSRGLFWLEPMVEVVYGDVRHAYGPVAAADVESLLAAGFLAGPVEHPLSLGPVGALPALQGQQRVTFGRVGVIDPLDPADYQAHGGLAGLRAALAMTPAEVVEQVVASGLRGRGGAGFPAGIKWRTVAAAPVPMALGETAGAKFVVCNADEGDSGTFADRMLMEGDPFSTLEGMVIAAYATGATEGYVYIRSEYPAAVATMRRAVEVAREQGWLGVDVLGSGLTFDVEVRVGAGAYICGEETSMLESIEGKRAVVRAKPPIPALQGLFGAPTVVNNLLTLATVPAVLAGGGEAYAAHGMDRSRGTQVFQLAGNVARGGIVEAAFGITLRELVEAWGGGTASGRPIGAVQVGGPLGSYLGADQLDLAMDYETFAAAGAMVGHGGIVVFDDTVDPIAQARFAMEFCAMGGLTPMPVRSAVRLWRSRADAEAAAATTTVPPVAVAAAPHHQEA